MSKPDNPVLGDLAISQQGVQWDRAPWLVRFELDHEQQYATPAFNKLHNRSTWCLMPH
jgi:hypothetical protein